MDSNNNSSMRKKIILIVIGVFVASKVFHIPIPFISSMSFFHLVIIVGIIYFFFRHSGQTSNSSDEKKYKGATVETKRVDVTPSDEPPHYEDEESLQVRNHVEYIQNQYTMSLETYSEHIKQNIMMKQLYNLERKNHSEYFFSLLKADANIMAIWSVDERNYPISIIPEVEHVAELTDEIRQAINHNGIYVTPLDLLFESQQFVSTIIVPIISPNHQTVGYIGLMYRCI